MYLDRSNVDVDQPYGPAEDWWPPHTPPSPALLDQEEDEGLDFNHISLFSQIQTYTYWDTALLATQSLTLKSGFIW